MAVFDKFKLLKEDMDAKGWVIEGFDFLYKDVSYIVLVKIYSKTEVKPQYALLKLEIMKEQNMNETLIVPVNSAGFMLDKIGVERFREFFNIDYAANLGNIIQQFSQYFSQFIPVEVSFKRTAQLKEAIISSLSRSDSEDPNKVYCFAVKRLTEGKRTIFNDNKTRLLRPSLYNKFKDDTKISFCYSDDENKLKSDAEIISSFSKR